jgi:hypothetical protein
MLAGDPFMAHSMLSGAPLNARLPDLEALMAQEDSRGATAP